MSLFHGFKKVITVTPSDTVNETSPLEGLIVLAAGNVTILPVEGSAITFTAVPAGTHIPIKIRRVNATGLTATVAGMWGG